MTLTASISVSGSDLLYISKTLQYFNSTFASCVVLLHIPNTLHYFYYFSIRILWVRI